jgi:flagellar basal-body rod protein FlgC
MINAIGIALTGLNSASQRLNASASNIANAGTTGSLTDTNNAPYTPKNAQSKALGNGGVQTQISDRSPAFIPAYDADSPFADENGLIGVPNVDYASEIVDMKLAEISYKTNLKTIAVSKDMFEELLSTFDKKV